MLRSKDTLVAVRELKLKNKELSMNMRVIVTLIIVLIGLIFGLGGGAPSSWE